MLSAFAIVPASMSPGVDPVVVMPMVVMPVMVARQRRIGGQRNQCGTRDSGYFQELRTHRACFP